MIIERILARRGFTNKGDKWTRVNGGRVDIVKRVGTTLQVQTFDRQLGLPLSDIDQFSEDDVDDFDDFLGEIA